MDDQKDVEKIMQDRIKAIKNAKWEVSVIQYSNSIQIGLCKGSLSSLDVGPWYVREPNVIESFFGVTLEDKLKKRVKKTQRIADKKNAREDSFKEAVKSLDCEVQK